MKKILILAPLVLAAGAAAFYLNREMRPEEYAGKTTTAIRGDLVTAVSATGTVEPNFKVEVKSKASGEILSFPFEPGDKVSAGQQLLRLDPETEKRNVALARADLARAEAELEYARATLMERESKLKRTRSLHERGLVAKEELEAAEAAAATAAARVNEASAALRKAELAVEDAEERLSETVINSPLDGVLIEKSVERGQIISSGITSFTGGTTLCVLADLSLVFVMTLVDETDIGMAHEGQEARMTVDAYPEKVFEGTVRRIYPMGEMEDNITFFKVKVKAGADGARFLRPGMTANVDLIVDSRKDVLIVPDETIRRDDDGKTYVYVLEKGRPSPRKVTVGLTNGFETQVTEGLSEGERILLRPPPAA
ncbi:MAG: efflux RND transporter periplasmic adaptor subunit [Candidatus Nitrospinota bacterium M3_3B_026]